MGAFHMSDTLRVASAGRREAQEREFKGLHLNSDEYPRRRGVCGIYPL